MSLGHAMASGIPARSIPALIRAKLSVEPGACAVSGAVGQGGAALLANGAFDLSDPRCRRLKPHHPDAAIARRAATPDACRHFESLNSLHATTVRTKQAGARSMLRYTGCAMLLKVPVRPKHSSTIHRCHCDPTWPGCSTANGRRARFQRDIRRPGAEIGRNLKALPASHMRSRNATKAGSRRMTERETI